MNISENSTVPGPSIIETAMSTAKLNLTSIPDDRSSPNVISMDTNLQQASPRSSSQQELMESDSPENSQTATQEKMLASERMENKNLISPDARPKSHPGTNVHRMSPKITTSIGTTGAPDVLVYTDTGGKDTPNSMLSNSPPTPSHEVTEAPVRAFVVYNEKGEATESIPYNPYSKDKVNAESFRSLMTSSYLRRPLTDDSTFPITCGTSKGDLFWRKFICPGINAKCVQCNEQWYTPKEFVQMAGKSTLKDWKRAIRINGTMLRRMIEHGEIDYFEHATNCSNQCRSNKNSSFECREFNHSFDVADARDRDNQLLPESRGPMERSNSEDSSLLSTKRAMLTSHIGQRISLESSGVSSLERSSSEDSAPATSLPQLDGVLMKEVIASSEKLQELQQFWTGISQTDIYDEFIRDLINKVTIIQQRSKQANIMSLDDSIVMTNITNSLELFPLIRQKMSNHKHNVERQAHDIIHQRRELERQLAEKRMDENDLKRKSQHLDTVMSLTPNTDKRKKKSIVRLSRQKAIESRNPPYQPCGTSTSQGRLDLPTTSMLRFTEPWSQQMALHAVAANSQMVRMNVNTQLLQLPPMGDPNFNHSLPKK